MIEDKVIQSRKLQLKQSLKVKKKMDLLRRTRGLLDYKDSSQLTNKVFICFDSIMELVGVLQLILSDERSQCLASFYLFWSLFYLSQIVNHYLLLRIPKIDVVSLDLTIKRLIGIVCFVEICYLFLVIIFWQKSNIHPIYCAVCEEFKLPFLIGMIFVFHFIFSAGFLINLIHCFVSRKYFLIALGGFEVEQRLAIQREQALRRIGLMQPNYAYPIDATIKSNKYYKFEDVIESRIQNEDICSICLNKKLKTQNIIKTKCNHFYHRSCIEVWATVNSRCPDCRAEFEIDFNHQSKLNINLQVIKEHQSQTHQQSQNI